MSECYGCINPNAACPSCKKNFDRMFAGRASTKGHQMNRDAGLPKLHETLDDLLAAALSPTTPQGEES